MKYLYEMLGEKYRRRPLMIKYFKARLERKIGKGVYDYISESIGEVNYWVRSE